MKKILLFPFTLLAFFVGRLSWTSPPWLKAISSLVKANPRSSIGLLVVALITGAFFLYLDSLPKPVMVKAEFNQLQITPNYEGAKPDNLLIQFEYDFSQLHADQQRPEGVPSVARIDLVGQQITQGIKLTPAKKGVWSWIDDRHIQFVPESDWSAGTDYEVSFDKSIFAEQTVLSSQSYQFLTPEFNAQFSDIEFYQDPQDISIRRVVSTLKFSHPVEKELLEENLSMSMRPSGEGVTAEPRPYNFKVNYDKNYREAFIQSEPVKLPAQANYMNIVLKSGVKSLLGGKGTAKEQQIKTLIPDIYSFLKIQNARTEIVRNEENKPEQMVMIKFTDDIHQDEINDKFSVYLLPTKGTRNGRRHWEGPRQVNANVIADSQKISLKAIPNARDFSRFFSFVVDVPENRFLYLKIDKGLKSVNEFVHSSFYDAVLTAPAYPKEINIAAEGSVLTHSGDHQLGIVTRGVPALKYRVGKLLKGQLSHLVSQTRGDISNPQFNNWNFDEHNISEFDTRIVNLQKAHPKEANYASIDLTQYLPKQEDRFGLFFVEVKAWDRKRNREIYGVSDKRLILVTNLGVIVKNNADRTHEVFVQSIADGEPVAKAKVELLGKNGKVIHSSITGADGHASLPTTKGLGLEKTPTVYVVKTANDLSFLPYERSTRQINLSRFDIGGVQSSRFKRDSLNAFVFSDRGIYRPGEEINIGMIVKNFDLSNVENIPLEMVVRGPRNREQKVNKFLLPEKGFAEYQFPTQATSDTGNYSVSLHMIRDEKYRGRVIGSANFKVEEFQPDSMKIESRLVGVQDKGWNTQDKINAKVTLKNLFGTPAQDRKVTGQVIIQPHKFNFKQFPDYKFTDPHFNRNKKPLSLNTRLDDQRSDADGHADFDINLQKFSEGSYQLRFITEGFNQAGGRSVIASNSTLISPLEKLIGYKADGKLDYINSGSERNIEFIAINKTLKQTDSENLKLKLIELQKVSTLVRQQNGTYKYQTISKEREISTEDLTLGSDGYVYQIDSENPGNYVIEIIDEEGRRLSRVNFSVVGFANLAGKIESNAELQLKLDKDDYFAGEIIEMSLKAPYAGAGLITIETDKVHHFKWFKTETESSVQQIQIPLDLEGTGYINVAFVRDSGSREIFTSPLSYAVAPFTIDSSKRRVDITLVTNDIVRPGKPMDILFSTSRPSKIAVFAIDEGILQVAKYKTPNPLAHFLKKRSLDVETLQMLDLILADFVLVKALSADGGGDGSKRALAKNLNPFARKTDKPAVFWSGIYNAGEKTGKVTFDVPNTFAGELRVMAVAVADEAVGAASTSSIVRGPFIISPNVLTQAAPGDEFDITVGVANIIEDSGDNALIDLSVSSSRHLDIQGSKSTQLTIAEGSEGKFTFRGKANSLLGAAQLTFTARFKDEELSRTTSFSVRPASIYQTTFDSGFAKSGEIDLISKRDLFVDLAQQSVAASASPLVIVDGLTSYLETFPHGCTEQVVSKVFPLVGLLSHPAYSVHLPNVKQHFSQLIDKLRQRQLGDGGFAFWPGHQNSDRYTSIYVMHFLLESSELGYPVPTDMMQRGKDYLKFYIQQSTSSISEARDRANAIYLLTRMGEITTNYLVDLEDTLQKNHKKAWKQDILASYMAATYKLLQKDQEAERLMSGYQLASTEHNELGDFHSVLAIDAQYIYLLSKHFEDRARDLDGEQIHKLTDQIFRGEYNTISSAYSILALGAYSKLVLQNDFNEDIKFKALDAKEQQLSLQIALQPFMKAAYDVNTKQVHLNSKDPLYYLNVQSGFNTQLPEKAVSEGVEIHRDYVDEQGNPVLTFEQGKEVTVRLKVRALNGRRLSNIAIIDLLPGGFEVIRSSVDRKAYGWQADYVDIREDRVIYYGTFDNTIRELTYKVKLTSAGDFVIPPVVAESMYDRSVRAVSESGRFSVTASQ